VLVSARQLQHKPERKLLGLYLQTVTAVASLAGLSLCLRLVNSHLVVVSFWWKLLDVGVQSVTAIINFTLVRLLGFSNVFRWVVDCLVICPLMTILTIFQEWNLAVFVHMRLSYHCFIKYMFSCWNRNT